MGTIKKWLNINTQAFAAAVEYLKDNGFVKNDAEIAKELGFSRSNLSQSLSNKVSIPDNKYYELFERYPEAKEVRNKLKQNNIDDLVSEYKERKNFDRLVKQLKSVGRIKTVADVAKTIKTFEYATVYLYMSGARELSYTFVEAFLNAYKITSNKNIVPLTHPAFKRVGIPVYNMHFSAGFVKSYDGNNEPQSFINLPELEGCDCVVKTRGESMMPTLLDNQWIGIKRIVDKNAITYGAIYCVVTKDLEVVKYLRKSPDAKKLILKSDNERFDDVEINKEDIISLWLVKADLKVNIRN